MSDERGQRVVTLDILRGLAIIGMVFLHNGAFHFSGLEGALESPPPWLMAFGFLLLWAGLFGVVSGAANATDNMHIYPDTTTAASKGTDANGVNFTAGDGHGYVLYQHDMNGGGANTSLVNYTATQYTKGTYSVDSSGTVTQVTTGYE